MSQSHGIGPEDAVVLDTPLGYVRAKVLRVEGDLVRVLDDEDPDATGEFWWPLKQLHKEPRTEMSQLREKWLAAREELRRLEAEIARQEAPTKVRVTTAGDLLRALRVVPEDAVLSIDNGDDGPSIGADHHDIEGNLCAAWLFILPDELAE